MTTTTLKADVMTPVTASKLKLHPVTETFPKLSPEEYKALKDDIDKNGLLDPIWIHDGQVLDGANRLKACVELGIGAKTREWKARPGESPLVFALSRNFRRRHLTPRQRAAIALESQPLIQAELESSPRGTNSKKRGPKTARTKATKLAAQAAGVSLRTMQRAMAASSNHKPRHRIDWLDRQLKLAADSATNCYEYLNALRFKLGDVRPWLKRHEVVGGLPNGDSHKKKLEKIDTSLKNARQELKNRLGELKQPKIKAK